MNIGLFTSVFFNNIGNGFIDLGAEATLKAAISSEDNLIKISQCANFAASMSKAFAIKENPVVNWLWVSVMQKFAKTLQDKTYKTVNSENVISAVDILHLDVLVIPGCVLTVPFFTIYGELLKKKVNEGCKLVFLGASGNFYSEYEVKIVSEYLNQLKPFAIMTRDSVAYDKYSKYGDYSYNGIDNVFFVNQLNIPKVETTPAEYNIINIEEPKHRVIKEKLIKELTEAGQNVIITNHKPYPYSKVSKMVKSGVIVSDYPLDYLILYKNAKMVYSDRVHACIPNMAFGHPAVLYSESPRKALFSNVGIDKIDTKPMIVKDLTERQENQICYLKKILNIK